MEYKNVKSIFPPSQSIVRVPPGAVIAGWEWLGEQISYPEEEKRGDTFPNTWASDDNIYTSAGDPVWGESKNGLDIERFSGAAPDYHITKINEMVDYAGWGGDGPKPTGMLALNGTLYLAFQNLTAKHNNNPAVMDYGHGYDAHIVSSTDSGKTWNPAINTISQPMFPGRLFGAPAFVNFGKANAGARDNYVYAISGEGWDNGSNCRLGRVPANRIMDRESWEWVNDFTGEYTPVWTRDLAQARPVLHHPGYLGMVDMVYLASIKRYLLLSWQHKVKSNPDTGSELIIYDSPEPWGPFSLVHHEDLWETTALNPYNPRLPLKWFDLERLEGWLLFSGSWRSGGQTEYYRTHIRKFKLVMHNSSINPL
jgi:hypothetical protein